MVVASSDPTLNAILSASLRFSESCIGTAMAVLTVLMRPGSKGAAQPGAAGNAR
jgi:CCR4-NOT transcriptional regulation complex NOT5 subunit